MKKIKQIVHNFLLCSTEESHLGIQVNKYQRNNCNNLNIKKYIFSVTLASEISSNHKGKVLKYYIFYI